MARTRRHFSLGIWGLALGYFCFYTPYSAVIKLVTSGLWPGVRESVSGFQLLPATVVSTAVVLPAIVSALGWWQHARRPSAVVWLSGLGTALIIGSTTIAYASTGVSILLALLLLRGGVLILAPVIDVCFKRRVRWFSWLALAFALAGVLVALVDVNSYQMTLVAAMNIVVYLTGYLLRLPCINTMAKCGDRNVTCRYFVEELLVAVILLVAIPAAWAAVGAGSIATDIRIGFTGLFSNAATVPGLLVGTLYAGLYVFGTLIYLDRRENTFCISLNRCGSMLAGIVATYMLTLLFAAPAPSVSQLVGSAAIIAALVLLSPLHHLVERQPARGPSLQPALDEDRGGAIGRVAVLFVCSGNTCRSPMAAAIANSEIAARLQLPAEAARQSPAEALSAGLSARVGAPMTPESRQALDALGIPETPHRARKVTAELIDRVERIFCMTKAHEGAVIDLVPAAAAKTQCLDQDGDIEDPIGHGLAAYISCAQRLQLSVRLRVDEIIAQSRLS